MNLISDGHGWLEALRDRNLTVHTYQEELAMKIELRIREQYYPLLQALHETFRKKLAEKR